jgi:shikimate kinase
VIHRCVFIIGFMASGKSRIGELVARELGWRFEDTDCLIERREKRPIPVIFREKGEEYFRGLETLVLRDLAGRCGNERLVVASGGGMPCTGDNLTVMKRAGLVVHLRVPIGELLRRMEGDRNRPLATEHSRRELIKLYRSRRRYYRHAHLAVHNGSGRSPRSVAEQITSRVRRRLSR